MSVAPAHLLPPEFHALTTRGHTVSIASHRGKVVLLTFWATWCRECRTEMPMFQRLHRKFSDDGLRVLGVNFRENTVTIQRYAKQLNLTFPLLLDPDGGIKASYGVIALPTTFLIGREGQPIGFAVGRRDWEGAEARELIEFLLAAPARSRGANSGPR